MSGDQNEMNVFVAKTALIKKVKMFLTLEIILPVSNLVRALDFMQPVAVFTLKLQK